MAQKSDNSPTVRLIVPPSFEGVSSVAVLQEILHDGVQLEIEYTSHLDFREFEKPNKDEITVILGLAYQGYILADNFYMQADVPFSDFIHFGTYGVPLEGEYIISSVSEESDPIKELLQFLETSPDSSLLSKHVTVTDKAKYIAEAVNAYRTWTWEANDTTRMLLAMYYASYKRLPHLLKGKSLQEAVRSYAAVIKGQLEKMNDYIERKRGTTKTYNLEMDGQPVILNVVYAEEYINELANDILNRNQSTTPVIVCVGRTTRSNDLLSIRTRSINAAKVAHLINGGNGKENVASVFSGMSYAELMGRALVSQLNRVTE